VAPSPRVNPKAGMPSPSQSETLPLREERDIVFVRRTARRFAVDLGFGLLEQTKMMTAASELARNTIVHGGGGTAFIETLEQVRRGMRITFEDHGPGIPDIALAMTDGYSTRRTLGLGLGGAKRLVEEFSIVSNATEGTRVTVTRWR
jgi:serine/threonine-protein kinase RsbT